MTREEELKLFLDVSDELIASKYILADVKIVNLLKAISISESLLAIFKNCLSDFDYEKAKEKYLVKSKYLFGDKGEFILPDNTKDLLAFVFAILVEIDAKEIDFSAFIGKYFYEDGSYSASYASFINGMIKPFRNSVKLIMESVIEGKLQDPIDAFIKEEARKAEEKLQQENAQKKEEELLKKENGENIKKIKDILLADTSKIKGSKLNDTVKKELTMVVNLFANVIESEDVDGISYAFVAYKYCAKVHKLIFFRRIKKISKLLKGILNEV